MKITNRLATVLIVLIIFLSLSISVYGEMNTKSGDFSVTYFANNTPIGTDVQVEIPEIGAIITFANVIKSGQTYISEFNDDPSPPAGYNVLSNYYDIVTTAEYTGDITICIDYDDSEAVDEENINILHYEEMEDETEIFALMQENINVGDTVWYLNATTYPDVLNEESLERLYFVIDGTWLEINKSNFVYNTSIYEENGESFIAWLDEPMFVIESGGDWYLTKMLINEKHEDNYSLVVDKTMHLFEGFAITLLEINVDGDKALISITKDGEEDENYVVEEGKQFIYEKDLNGSGVDDNWVLRFYLENVSLNSNSIKINKIQLLDPELILIETPDDDLFSNFVIKNDNNNALIIELDSSDDTIDLELDGVVNLISDKFRFKLDENGDTGGVLKRQDVTGLWQDVTSSRNTDTNIICGVITNLSDFVIAESIVDDTIQPTAILTQPEEGAYISGTIDINGTVNSTNFHNYTIEWKNTTVDWTEIHNSTVPVSDGTLATWNTSNLEDGDYSIRLTVADNVYNLNVTAVNVTIDNTLPIIYSVSLNDNMVKIGDTISLRVNATDNISNDLTVIWHGINETGIETGNITLENIEKDLYGIDLIVEEDHPEGIITLNISVLDEANNIVYNDSLKVTIDMTPPSVTSLSLSTLVPVIGESVNITANVDDTNITTSGIFALVNSPTDTYELQMKPSISDEYYFNFPNTTEFGKYTITLSASDEAGNVNNSETTWFITVLPPFVNNSINTTENNVTPIDALEEVNTTLELFTSNDTTNVSIEITMSNNIPPRLNQNFGIDALGKYISINVSGNLNDNLTWAIIKIYYTQAELEASGLDESSLVLRYHNETSGEWEPLTPSGVNTATIGNYSGYVWANVSHFSYYGVAGELKEEKQPPSNGNGGGSSGVGASGELYENIACSETDRQYLYANSDISYSFELDRNIVQYVNFTCLKSAGQVATKVEILNDTSTLVDHAPSNEVYKNLNIWVGNAGWATARNIADATVVFTVEKSWITENNIDESSIALYHYRDDKWHELVTRKIAEDANSLQFEAETTGFSPFAVSGKKTMGETGGEGIIEPTVTAEKTTTPTPTEKKGMPGFGLFAGLSILLITVQLLCKKK